MKLMTLNIHSHDTHFDPAVLERSMKELAEAVIDHDIAVLALQECSQELERPFVSDDLPLHCAIHDAEHVLREGNAALLLAEELQMRGAAMDWVWAGVKLGYQRYNEGLALFSRFPIRSYDAPWISGIQEFSNWKSRNALIASTEINGSPVEFCCVHMGRWDDPEESFKGQMERLDAILPNDHQVFLLGDFNSPAGKPNEGWEMVRKLGWHDTYEAAKQKGDGITVPGVIDGWQDGAPEGMRIDYIFSRMPVSVRSSFVLFDGKHGPLISDHYGLMADLDY